MFPFRYNWGLLRELSSAARGVPKSYRESPRAQWLRVVCVAGAPAPATVTGPGRFPATVTATVPRQDCYNSSNTFYIRSPRLDLLERVGLSWSDREYAAWYANDAVSDWERRELTKMAQELVSAEWTEHVPVLARLRFDAPAYHATKEELLGSCTEFVEQFIEHPDALDILLASPATVDLMIHVDSIDEYY